MSVQKIIQESIGQNPLGLKEALTEELRARVALALEAKMKESDEEEDDDESEQIDEVSKGKLKDYMDAARKDMRNRYYDDSDESDKKFSNRSKGIEKALDKRDANSKAKVPATESFELEEALDASVVRGDSYSGVPDGIVMRAKDQVKKMNPSTASDHTRAMYKALSGLGWEKTAEGKWVKESVEITGKSKLEEALAAKMEEVEQIDEISKSTLGSYATKALNRADIAARMSKSDSDEMGKIADKRTAGVKKAVDRLAGKKTAASIKSNIDKAREAARNRGTDKDDQGKAYYAAQKGISKVREAVELEENFKEGDKVSFTTDYGTKQKGVITTSRYK